MDIICKGCRVRLRVPESYFTGDRLKVRCKNCGSPIILLGKLPEVQALGATIASDPPHTQRPQSPRADADERFAVDQQVQRQASSPHSRSDSGYPAPGMNPERVFEGSRHENSVLFTLANLKDIAKKREAASSATGSKRGGYANGDGSGYIDIRALVSLSRQNATPDAAASAAGDGESGVSKPNVPAPSNPPSTIFEGTASLAPVTLASESSNRALPMAIVAGFAMLVAAGFISFSIIRQGDPTRLAAAGATISRFIDTRFFHSRDEAFPAEPAAKDAPVKDTIAVDRPLQTARIPNTTLEKPHVEPATMPEQGSPRALPIEKPKAIKRAIEEKSQRTNSAARSESKNEKKSAPIEASEKKTGLSVDDIIVKDAKDKKKEAAASLSDPGETDLLSNPFRKTKAIEPERSVDELLDEAVAGDEKTKPEPAAPSAQSIPETPTRQQVMKAIREITPAARQCASSASVSGVVNLTIVVSGPSGQVTSVQTNGIDEPVGLCVVQEVKKARFPTFTKPELSINYPLKL
ncbi:MAG: hypothetical protein JXA30_15270 [Deltaproteobacteria bacterium]|nr:hypothetical protein [Deltaproteobacteria bacterium]